MASTDFRPVVIIPVYNHPAELHRLVGYINNQKLACILIDDGSDRQCASLIDQVSSLHSEVFIVRHTQNRGKGAAVMSGLREAKRRGYSHALQIDADGQHYVQDIPDFLVTAMANPSAVIIGTPIYDESVPKSRLYARYLTHIWVWINTLSFAITDSMCGFRVYPLDPVIRVLDRSQLGERMDFDSEVLVRLCWMGAQIVNRPTKVIYPKNGISHFNAFNDNVRISIMHTKLFFGMLWRMPVLLYRKFSRLTT